MFSPTPPAHTMANSLPQHTYVGNALLLPRVQCWSKIISQVSIRLKCMVTAPLYKRWIKIISQIDTRRKYIFTASFINIARFFFPTIHTSKIHFYCTHVHMLVENHFPNVHLSERHYYCPSVHMLVQIVSQINTRLKCMVTVPVYTRCSKIISKI